MRSPWSKEALEVRGAPRSGEDGSGSSKGYRSGTAAGRGVRRKEIRFVLARGWHFPARSFQSHPLRVLVAPSVVSHQSGLTKPNQSVMKQGAMKFGFGSNPVPTSTHGRCARSPSSCSSWRRRRWPCAHPGPLHQECKPQQQPPYALNSYQQQQERRTTGTPPPTK